MATSVAASVVEKIYPGGAGKPEQQQMLSFQSACLDVNGLDMVVDGNHHYKYKVPFAIQLAKQPLCTRLGWFCCPCCCPKTGPQDAMDFVNQENGDQIRFHRIKKKVHVFHNGQYEGYLKPTWRICGKCRDCIDEVNGGDIPLVSLFDKSGDAFAKVSRPGRGCCCTCRPYFPFRCVNGKMLGLPMSFFACCSCTCECWPAKAVLTGCPAPLNGMPTCGLPHGCLVGNPVCCDCCVRGSLRAGGCSECPVICCPNPCGCIACCCLCPNLTTKELPIHSTFKYQDMDLTKGGNHVGKVQLQYRGNVPFASGFTHDESMPHTAAMEVGPGGSMGLVSSAILVAKSYALGAVAPLLDGMQVATSGPDFHGYVTTYNSEQVDELLRALDADNRVTQQVLIGQPGRKINVHGYTLIEVGYDNSWFNIGPCALGGGESRKPMNCTNRAKAEEYIGNAREGGTRPTFTFRFYMEDPEVDIVSRKACKEQLDDKWYDFYHYGREQVYLTCSCIRFCKFPMDTTLNRVHCCKCPLYQRDRMKIHPVSDANDGGQKAVKAPNQVIMRPGKKVVALS